MDFVKYIPEWIKKYGILGLIILLLAQVLRLIFDAIVEKEVQDGWQNSGIRDAMLTPVTIQFPLIFLFGVAILLLSVGIIWLIYSRSRLYNRLQYPTLNLKRLPAERRKYTDRLSVADIMSFVEQRRKGRKSEAETASSIQDAINQRVISPQLGSELANEFKYVVTIKPDGKYIVEKGA